MKQIALSIFILFFPLASFAAWEQQDTGFGGSYASSAQACVQADENLDGQVEWNLVNLGQPYYIDVSETTKYYPGNDDPYYECLKTTYSWVGEESFIPPPGSPVIGSPYTDQQCQSQYGGSYQIPGTTAGNIDTVSAGACTLSSSGVAVCTASGCFAEWDATSSGESNAPVGSYPSTTEPLPDYLTETDDPSSCPSGYMGAGGKTYCVDQGAIDDGSISIVGGDITYPPLDTDSDGVPDKNDPTPGTGDTVGGGSDGAGGTTTEPGGSYGGGGSFGDPGGSSGDADGDGTDDGACSVFLGGAVCNWLFGVPDEPVQPELPVETITADDLAVDFDSGLSITATCPPPEVVNVAFGSFAKTVEIPYTNICTFAEMIRGLVIAAAYMAAAFITYRGVVA